MVSTIQVRGTTLQMVYRAEMFHLRLERQLLTEWQRYLRLRKQYKKERVREAHTMFANLVWLKCWRVGKG